MDIQQLKDCKDYLNTIVEDYIYNLHNLIYEVNEFEEDSDKYKKAKKAKPEWEKEIRKMVQECQDNFKKNNDLPKTEFFPVCALFDALWGHPDDENIAFDIQDCLDNLIEKVS